MADKPNFTVEPDGLITVKEEKETTKKNLSNKPTRLIRLYFTNFSQNILKRVTLYAKWEYNIIVRSEEWMIKSQL